LQTIASLNKVEDPFDVIPLPVFFVDDTLQIKKTNNAASRLFNKSIINSPFPSLLTQINTNENTISIA
jgi:nitrogen-specific signal transduction histidine kinase